LKDNAFFAVLLIASIGANLVFAIVLADCPPKQKREREAANVEMELETLRRRLDQSMKAMRDAGIPVNEVFGQP
jgi:outer membrane murein-binding lipoprotein Lpp